MVVLLLAAPLAGCLTLVEEEKEGDAPEEPRLEPYETDDTTQPAANRNVVYLHSMGESDLWMDVESDATDTILTSMVTPLTEDTWYLFAVRPVLNRTLNMTGGEATAAIAFSTGASAGLPFTVEARLVVDGERVSAGQTANMFGGTVNIPLKVPDSIPGGSDVGLEVCICAGQASFTTETQLRTDGSSFLKLPIETPVYVDLDSKKGGSNGTGDADTAAGRSESDVETSLSGDRWTASKTITLTGGLGGLTSAEVDFATVNGGITVEPWNEATYEAVVTLEGHGDSEQAARDRLARLRVAHEDETASSGKHVGVEVQSTDRWRNQTGIIHVKVPRAATYGGLSAETVNGRISVDGLTAGAVDLSTVNGDVVVQSLKLTGLHAETTNGGIDAHVESTADGSYELSSTNGPIDLVVPDGPQHGYDAEANNVNGGISIDLSDTEPVGSQSTHQKHVRTADYDARHIKVRVGTSTVNGGIDITGS